MNWLLWKDYRDNRLAVYTAPIFMVVPHLIVLYTIGRDAYRGSYDPPERMMQLFALSTLFGLLFSQLSIAILAGNAFAGERANRSADFLGSLPISRVKILASKLLLSLILILVIWSISLLLMKCLLSPFTHEPDRNIPWQIAGYTAVTTTAFFCVAWCLSSFLASPMSAVLGGLLAPAILWGVILFGGYLSGQLDAPGVNFENFAASLYCKICLISAPILFTAGTWYYLRRVEP